MVVFLIKSSTSFGKSDGERAAAINLPAFGIITFGTAKTFDGVDFDGDVFFHRVNSLPKK